MTYPNSELIELQEKEDIRKKYLALRIGYKQFAEEYHKIWSQTIPMGHHGFYEECTHEVCKLSRKLLEQTKI